MPKAPRDIVRITFVDGPRDGYKANFDIRTPNTIKLNMGRDTYTYERDLPTNEKIVKHKQYRWQPNP